MKETSSSVLKKTLARPCRSLEVCFAPYNDLGHIFCSALNYTTFFLATDFAVFKSYE